MSLKDILQEDLDSVFFDAEEFAELHIVNGKEMLLLLDGNELSERKTTQEKHLDGVYSSTMLLYVKANAYGARPKVGSMLVLDEKQYRVTDVVEEGGVYSITIGAMRA